MILVLFLLFALYTTICIVWAVKDGNTFSAKTAVMESGVSVSGLATRGRWAALYHRKTSLLKVGSREGDDILEKIKAAVARQGFACKGEAVKIWNNRFSEEVTNKT